MTFLLDANVLIALIDPQHVHHDPAHEWFGLQENIDWATCPLTENAVVRIISQPSYPNPAANPEAAIDMLRELCAVGRHQFWPDSISLLDSSAVLSGTVLSPKRITDIYLVALGVSRRGKLATFDRRIYSNASPEWRDNIELILP